MEDNKTKDNNKQTTITMDIGNNNKTMMIIMKMMKLDSSLPQGGEEEKDKELIFNQTIIINIQIIEKLMITLLKNQIISFHLHPIRVNNQIIIIEIKPIQLINNNNRIIIILLPIQIPMMILLH